MSNKKFTNSSIHFPPLLNTPYMHILYPYMVDKCNIKNQQTHRICCHQHKKSNTKGCQKIYILWTGHRQHKFSRIGQFLIITVSCNQKHFEKVTKLLNYLATSPSASIQYYSSGMILHVHSDAYHMSIKKNKKLQMRHKITK